MNIYEAIGMAWVIFTSVIASVAIPYLAFVGLKAMLSKQQNRDSDIHVDVPDEVKEMFKIAR